MRETVLHEKFTCCINTDVISAKDPAARLSHMHAKILYEWMRLTFSFDE